jgi:PKD domain-containing protein
VFAIIQRHGLKVAFASMAILALLGSSVSVATALAPNDNFASATSIDLNALPYTDTQDLTDATNEAGEQFYCSFSFQTVWYTFTTTTDSSAWLDVRAGFNPFGGDFTLYSAVGPGIGGLNVIQCSFGSPIVFRTQAQTTYYIQAKAPCCGVAGTMRVDVQQAAPPQPVADFYFYPSDPSVFDVIQFQNQSYDPGQVGIASHTWNFGDGSADTSCCPTHHYTTDGNKTVSLAVTTYDGRSASASRVVAVQTHDVGITNFKTPQAVAKGQTRQVVVGIKNTRYPERVRVELLKSTTGGFGSYQQIGYSEQVVPVRTNRTTDFSFSYTFTSEDALIGKVTFKAVANMSLARDAFPADNEAVSSPVKVNKFAAMGPIAFEDGVPEAPVQLALRGVGPNPSSAGVDLHVRVSLPGEEAATLRVLDVSGRVMAQRDLVSLGPGTHDVRLAWDRRPAPGVYWVRLTQNGESVSTRVAILE